MKNLIDPDKKTIVVGDTNINYQHQNNHRLVKLMTDVTAITRTKKPSRKRGLKEERYPYV